MNKKQILAKIKKHSAAISKHRDELRELKDELAGLVDSADEGLAELDRAIDILSQYL